MHFVIDESRWRSGGDGDYRTGRGETKLLNEEGFACCVGQMCQQLGAPDSLLLNKGVPSDIDVDDLSAIAKLLTADENGELIEVDHICDCIMFNDQESVPLASRKLRIANRLKEAGHTVEFVNQPVR